MSAFDALVLGLVQGVAEFLPISSSGHLILLRELMGLQTERGLAVDATLQFATALAVVLYFRHDLARLVRSAYVWLRGGEAEVESRTLILALAFGTVPAVIAGLLLEDIMDTLFRNPSLVAWVLIGGSLLFVLAEYMATQFREHRTLSVRSGILIGFFQALALVPGVSRSGATISGGMLLGLSREQAARFAFLLSVPIILGSGAKKLFELSEAGLHGSEWYMISLACAVAFGSGIASIHYLLRFLKTHTLWPFIWYRLALAAAVFVFL